MILVKLADNNLELLKGFFMGVVTRKFFHKTPNGSVLAARFGINLINWLIDPINDRLVVKFSECFNFTIDATFRSMGTVTLADKRNPSHSISLTKKIHLL